MEYSKRCNETRIYNAFIQGMITGILGPRRVGKSTLLDRYLELHPTLTVVRLNMDSMQEREQIETGQLEAIILTSIQRHLEPNNRVWVMIDEAQKCPALFEQIKRLYDRYKDQDAIKFIITGSALLELHRLSAETLAGRINLYYLSAFSLSETLTLRHGISVDTNIFTLLEAKQQNESDWQDYFYQLLPLKEVLKENLLQMQLWGGLPEVLTQTSTEERLDYLGNYLQTYLEKDVRAIESITDLTLYRQLIDIAAEQTGSVRDDTRILQALGCHRETLNKYRGYLQATLMYQDIHPYINAALKRLVKSPKGYLINNGLISFITGIYDINLLEKTGQIGHRLENWLLNELQIWLNSSAGHHSANYWRTSSGVEVDFVVNKAPDIYAFEVTYAAVIESKKVRNLIKFREHESKTKLCCYVYMGEFNYDAENNILFIPAWAVLS